MLKVSVITVCYNSADTIEKTIRSVTEQEYPEIEYIIIDGKSTDNTLEVIKRAALKTAKVLSEKDKGIYDAINKGISWATGDIVAILHADDFYVDKKVITKVVQVFAASETDTVYGDLQYVDRNNTAKVTRNWVSGNYNKEEFRKGWMPPHPSFFVRRKCYEKYGLFNTDFKSAADYELMLRFLYKFECSASYIPEVLVKMRIGGKSNVSFLNRIKANREDKKAWEINGLKPGRLTFIRKPLRKLGQFFK
ncbi:MAG: glycosyltransferase [Bacteroidota bacterium]|nr:glycosyltransferase [Bacteroidota bacterium]